MLKILNKKSNGLILMDKTSFSYYTANNQVLTFTYPTSSIKELDIVNEQIFISEVTNFFKSNNILPSTIIVILSNEILYEKDFNFEPQSAADKSAATKDISLTEQVTLSAEEKMAQMQTFLDLVPFDEIASKSYKIDKTTKLIATNKKLYELMVNLLNKLNFIVEAVIPITVIPNTVIDTPNLNPENAKKIFKKFDALFAYSLLEENSYALSRAALAPRGIKMSTKVSSKREFALIGVFIMLILVLGIVSYTTFLSPVKDRKIASESKFVPPTVAVLPSDSPTPDPVSTLSAQFNNDLIRIQINGGTLSQVNLLKQDLVNNGFINITPKPNNIATSGRITVVLSSVLPGEVRETVISQLKKSFLNVTAQEAELTEADVIVNL